MQIWQDIVKTALVGTERQAPPIQNASEELASLLSQLEASDREKSLLSAAGILASARRAGYQPGKYVGVPIATSPQDETPRCRDAAASDLVTLMQPDYNDLLVEWFQAVAARGQRLPEEWLPTLLDFARTRKELQSPLLPVLGERGRWLASQNSHWNFAMQLALFAGEAPVELNDEVWETGTRYERTAFLIALRGSDPARARELLEAVWDKDGHEERAAFIGKLNIGLSMDDEPFLEKALDDKRKEVRLLAQSLLYRLPESRLCLRLIERARPLLTLVRTQRGDHYLTVELPSACDKPMIRDGIEPKPPQGTGERAHWFSQIIASTPLDFWTRNFQLTPEEIIRANRSSEWSDALLTAWTKAAERQEKSEWAVPLLNYWVDNKKEKFAADLISWNQVVPKEILENCAIRLLESHPNIIDYYNPVKNYLDICGPVWGATLARAVHRWFVEEIRRKKSQDVSHLSYTLNYVAGYIPESEQDNLLALWESIIGEQSFHQTVLARHKERIQFRREMLARVNG